MQNSGPSFHSRWSKLQSVTVFCIIWLHCKQMVLSPHCWSECRVKNMGHRWKQLFQGGLGLASRYSARLNKQHRARRGREGWIKGNPQQTGAVLLCVRLGGPDARAAAVARFVSCQENRGSCCCLGGLCPPSGDTVQGSPCLNSFPSFSTPTEPASLSHTHTHHTHRQTPVHPSAMPHRAGTCPGEWADVQSEGNYFYCVRCQAKVLFMALKEIPVSDRVRACVCVCVNSCLKRKGDQPRLNSELFLCICYKCKWIDIPLCSILFNAEFLTQLPFTIIDLKNQTEYHCGLLEGIRTSAGASQ